MYKVSPGLTGYFSISPVAGVMETRVNPSIAEVIGSRTYIEKYGIIKFQELVGDLYKLEDLIEKPSPEEAFSNLAVAGRYILSSRIFTALEATSPGRGGEIQLTDGLKMLLKEQDVLGYRFPGKRYDAGEPIGLLKVAVDFALNRRDIGAEFRDYLRKLLRE